MARILEEALSASLISTLRKLSTLNMADTTKHCTNHCNYRHTIEDSHALKDNKIAELIQAGHLHHFVKRDDKSYSRRNEREG